MFMSRLFVATVLTVALQAAAAAVNVEVCNEGQMGASVLLLVYSHMLTWTSVWQQSDIRCASARLVSTRMSTDQPCRAHPAQVIWLNTQG